MNWITTKLALPVLALTASCLDLQDSSDVTDEVKVSLFADVTSDAIGKSETASPTPIDLTPSNPFFRAFGTNGRTCGTCHQEDQGWTITPAFARSRPASDPLFVFDGSDCLPPGVPNPDPVANSKQMRSKANVRIDIGIPAAADFTLVSFTDPLHCPTAPSAAGLRMYRRPLPTANSAFLSTVMWDGRENVNPPNNTVPLIQADLKNQANDATRGHAQAGADLSDADRAAIVTFETNLFNAQKKVGGLLLRGSEDDDDDDDQSKVHGGAKYLFRKTLPAFFIGINDVLGCAIPNSCAPGSPTGFTSKVFTVFANWEPGANPPNDQAAAIGRGERIFNTKQFAIDDVAGINRDPGDPVTGVLNGFCGTCHDSTNIGNHSTALPIDIGIAAAVPVGGLDVAQLPTYTFRETSTGRTITVTDPARGLISGKFRDIGKTKGPNLRALAARAPYFHNGSAPDLASVVNFYDARFHIGFTNKEKRDLVAFLNAL